MNECELDDRALWRFGLYLKYAVVRCLEDPENMAAFKKWYLEQYGQEYVPKERIVNESE